MSESAVVHACITCGDVALPMRVLALDHGERSLADCVSAEGRHESVEIALVEPVVAGEWLLVHAGTAIGRAQDADVQRRATAVGARLEGGEGRAPTTGALA